jgi:hypothetical protein
VDTDGSQLDAVSTAWGFFLCCDGVRSCVELLPLTGPLSIPWRHMSAYGAAVEWCSQGQRGRTLRKTYPSAFTSTTNHIWTDLGGTWTRCVYLSRSSSNAKWVHRSLVPNPCQSLSLDLLGHAVVHG